MAKEGLLSFAVPSLKRGEDEGVAMEHYLEVVFKKKETEVLYDGASYLRENLSDQLYISDRKIRIFFSRSKKMPLKDVLDSSNSLIRYQLQRALCFYLAVQGTIPDVSSITFFDGIRKHPIAHESFTDTWKNCNLDILLPKEAVSAVFSERDKGKRVFVVLTYFIKAQLDLFSHDRFRAAWSGINGIYRTFCSNDKEKEYLQIRKLGESIVQFEMKNSQELVSSLSAGFWDHLEWYAFVHSRTGDRPYYFLDKENKYHYSDSVVLERLLLAYKSAYRDEERTIKKDPKKTKNEYSELTQYVNDTQAVIDRHIIDYKEQIRFLVCKYCYMRRNRSFHAEKAYPVFVISKDTETGSEQILTRLLLLVIKDFLISDEYQTAAVAMVK